MRTRLLTSIVAIVTVTATVLLAVGPASDSTTKSRWSFGWDEFSGSLNFSQSNVRWNEPNGSTRNVTYDFVGANPNASYLVGIALLYSNSSQSPAIFGQFILGSCLDVTRQSVTSWQDDTNGGSPAGVGRRQTDSYGDGALLVNIVGVSPGNYALEFYANGNGGPGAINCQSPGPFGTGVSLTFAA
jgi:hypothetical protein